MAPQPEERSLEPGLVPLSFLGFICKITFGIYHEIVRALAQALLF